MDNLEDLITILEDQRYQWDVGYTGHLREARVWVWPQAAGRYRPVERETAFDMLKKAAINAGIDLGE